MVCYSPLQGFRARDGSRKLVFNRRAGWEDLPVTICCNQCIGCRLERSRQWAVRCVHESKLYSRNCFITLTYSDKFLPANRSLILDDFQKFMKRLRKRYGSGIRVFYCGEYGPNLGRPHYHALIFNFDFDDRKKFLRNHRDEWVYTSEKLAKVWKKGFCTVADLTFDSAAYCARYVMKKVTGAAAEMHYQWFDLETRVLHQKVPEFAHQSRRPGLAAGHFDKFMSDVYPSDFVVVNGAKCRPPRFYDNRLELVDPLEFARTKARRVQNAKVRSDNNSSDRLKVREELTKLRLQRLKRENI